MRQKWINFIAKQYRKYYPDPVDDLSTKLENKKFKTKTELFNYICEYSIGGLKRILNNSLFKIKRKEDKDDK